MTTGNTMIGHGSIFNLISGSTTTPINGVIDGSFGSNKVDTLDNTGMATAGSARTFQGGLENPGDFSLKLNYLPGDTSQGVLFTAKDGTVHNFSFVQNPTTPVTEAFSGIITAIDKSVPDDKLATLTVKIQISGPRTLA